MRWILRTFRVACVAILSIVLLTFAAVKFQQHLLRHRAEQLIADMHRFASTGAHGPMRRGSYIAGEY